jgi:hypothetical protein
VHPLIQSLVVWTSLLAGLVGMLTALLDRPAGRPVLATAALAELAALAQSVVAAVELARGHDVPSPVTFVGYLVALPVILPFALAWAWSDRNRWSGAVVALGALTLVVMTRRLEMLWAGTA